MSDKTEDKNINRFVNSDVVVIKPEGQTKDNKDSKEG